MAPGKKLNFLTIPRDEHHYRPKEERLKDFKEVELFQEIDEIKTQASRCMDCGIPFCHSYGCPLTNIIPEINSAVTNDDFKTAWELLRSRSSFPEFTSRICPALCEFACTAGKELGAVDIRHIEYMVIEEAFRLKWVQPRIVTRRKGVKAAVIGAGPAGLAAADELNQYGFDVTVFEKNQKPGGLLRYGIPDFKLCKNVIDRRLDVLKAEGIKFQCGTEIGRDISAAYLKKQFDVLVMTMGTPVPRDLKIAQRELNGIHFALDFLGAQNRVVSGESAGTPISAKGKKVLVIGGGDTGSDCIGTANRQGAASVTQIELMPEPPEVRHPGIPWPEYPYVKKTSSSHEEGCTRLWSINSLSFYGENGAVKGLNAEKIAWTCSPTGRPLKFDKIPESGFKIEADLVLLAMGFTGVSAASETVQELGLSVDERGRIVTDCHFQTPVKNVFAAGDTASGASLVVRAIASGRKCAAAINELY